MSYIEFKDVYKRYNSGDSTVCAADGVDFGIEEGEFAVIVGTSGAGKTTVLNILGGIDSADSGTVTVDGCDICSLSKKELTVYRRNDIGFVFQFYNLIPNLTAEENIEIASQISSSDADIENLLKTVGLENKKGCFPSQLTGGEQQRIAIARAIAKSPKLLLCDEPTGALDYETGKSILKLLYDTCKEKRVTVVLITHNTAIAPMADRVIRMKSGKAVSNTFNRSPSSIDTIEW